MLTQISDTYSVTVVLLRDKLRIARDKAGLSQADVARQLGIASSAVSQWETGDTEPAKKRLPLLAQIFGVSINYFLESTQPVQEASGTEVTEAASVPENLPPESQMPRDVPIYGVAAANEEDGAFNMEAEIVDYGRRPPAMATARDLYGLFVASDSMEPVYRRGDLIYVRRRLPPRPGDDVIVQIAPERDGEQPACFVKRLKRRTADRIIVEQFNPPKDIQFPVNKVIAVHRVLTLGEVLGS